MSRPSAQTGAEPPDSRRIRSSASLGSDRARSARRDLLTRVEAACAPQRGVMPVITSDYCCIQVPVVQSSLHLDIGCISTQEEGRDVGSRPTCQGSGSLTCGATRWRDESCLTNVSESSGLSCDPGRGTDTSRSPPPDESAHGRRPERRAELAVLAPGHRTQNQRTVAQLDCRGGARRGAQRWQVEHRSLASIAKMRVSVHSPLFHQSCRRCASRRIPTAAASLAEAVLRASICAATRCSR